MLQKKTSSERSIDPYILRMPQIILCLWGFLFVKDAGCRGNIITEHVAVTSYKLLHVPPISKAMLG